MFDGSSLIPECYIDTNLIETISFKGCNHQKSCSMVANTMKKKYAERFAVGIIDKDKKEISYLKEFSLIANTQQIYLFKHKEKPHYIIQIAPAVEKFILAAVAEKNIKLSDYALPDDFEELKKRTKSVESKQDVVFRELFKNISDSSNMMTLRKVLQYLVKNTYYVDIESLKVLLVG